MTHVARFVFLMILVPVAMAVFGSRALAARGVESTTDTTLCMQCHVTGDVSKKHAQVPGGDGNCLNCHSPHTLVGPTLLRLPDKQNCTACHDQYTAKSLQAGLAKGEATHDPVMKGKCSECHLPHDLGAQARFKGGDKNASCTSCHEKNIREKDAPYEHAPFKSGFCVDCHNPHRSQEPKLVRKPQSELCVSCHAAESVQQTYPTQHEPFKSGRCTDCHTSHAGKYPKNLKVAATELCSTCHFPSTKPVKHAPYQDGTCTQCHSPHASKTTRLLAASSPTELCAKCHAPLMDQFKLPSHHPVGERMECSNCHLPHSSDNRKLLPAEGSGFCMTCHQSQGANYGNVGHSKMTVSGSAGKGVCTACHLPHGSANSPLLKQPSVGLCRACHQPMSKFEHPMGEGVKAPGTGKPVVCSTCHNPHGTRYEHGARKQGDGLCITCHDK